MNNRLSILCGLLLAVPAMAGNFYVTPTGTSTGGTNWSNAFCITNINWAAVSPGDTIWLAGGVYDPTKDWPYPVLYIKASGSAANPIYIKRVLASDNAPTNSLGWSSSFDSPVVLLAGTWAGSGAIQWDLSSAELGSYITIDGRTTSGIKLYSNTNSGGSGIGIGGGGAYQYGGAVSNIFLLNLELIGPNLPYSSTNAVTCNFTNGNAIQTIPSYGSGANCALVTVSNCIIHNWFQSWMGNQGGVGDPSYSGVVFDHCKIYHNGGAGHNEIWYDSNPAGPLCIRYCEIWDWASEGEYIFGPHTNALYVYGNIFHDDDSAACTISDEDSTGSGPSQQYWVNNTFYNIAGSTIYGKTTYTNYLNQLQVLTWVGTNSVFKNNLYVGCSMEYKVSTNFFVAPPGIWDYNYFNTDLTNSGQDTHSINNSGVNPLVNPGVGGDFHIVSTIGATYPRNKGVAIASVVDPVLGVIDFSKDPDGNTRGADGAWDIGAYEYSTATGKPYAPVRK